MINYAELPEILLDNGFKEIKEYCSESKVKTTFKHGKHNIVIFDGNADYFETGWSKKSHIKFARSHLIGVLVHINIKSDNKKYFNASEITGRYNIAIEEKNDGTNLYTYQKELIPLYESFEFKTR